MRSFLVVVLHVGPQNPVEVPGAEDQRPVQTVGASGLHPALGEGVRVRGPDRCADHANPFAGEDIIKGAGELGVAVADEELDTRALVGLSLIHISEPTRLLSISYAVFCLKKKKIYKTTNASQ